ncbi:YkyA family protein [Sporosarcina sp. 179-K 3D1 HS]|uniref:YkyA family protein n=1 Tax=Sporosarcina sp. 179-K 3D1 HS TaxID=3232169 RepID=UPI0039A1B3AA
MKKSVLGLLIGSMILLTGCSFDSSVEKMLSETLSKMNDAEQEYRNAQAELTEIEMAEQQLFIETMKLSREQREELEAKTTQLEEQQAERMELVETEKKAMGQASSYMEEFNAIIENAEGSVQEELKQLQQAMKERYEQHGEFLPSYTELATLQKELYQMLTEEETDYRKLKEQVQSINELNEKVQLKVEAFNNKTRDVNELREKVEKSLQQDQ